MSFVAAYKMHLKRLFTRREFYFVATIMFVIITGAFLESCFYVFGWSTSTLNSAALGWIMHMDQQPAGINTARVFVFLLFGLLASMLYGDSLYSDRREKVLPIAAVRSEWNKYILGGGLAAFTGAFITFFLAFTLSQVLSLIVYPINSSFFDYYATVAWEDSLSRHPLFPEIYYRMPYLNNLIYMIYASVWAGILSFMSYTASLFLDNRLLITGLPQIFLIIESFVGILPVQKQYSILYYLYPTSFLPEKSVAFFFFAPITVLSVLILIFICCIKTHKKEVYL